MVAEGGEEPPKDDIGKKPPSDGKEAPEAVKDDTKTPGKDGADVNVVKCYFRGSKEKPRNVIFKVTQERRPVWSDIKIQNPTNDRKTFKVKCTSAEIFRVQPPLGFIKPLDTTRIRVWFQVNFWC
ncbi:hypothetical protein ANCCAN_24595 [Ancylostoma caninum]|uniref:Major sperm protein n=1 Tax=Ancylostoma caninum TaxID=29170 RepID=A0A368FBZ5_ANCCA|nr:hypothetical protein ANCCAN_24595 [Ancylostoma caninum]